MIPCYNNEVDMENLKLCQSPGQKVTVK